MDSRRNNGQSKKQWSLSYHLYFKDLQEDHIKNEKERLMNQHLSLVRCQGGVSRFFAKNVEVLVIILEHVREGLVAILEDLDKHPHLLQELQEFQNFQLEDLQLPQQAMVRTLQGQPQQAMLESLQGQPQQAMLETLQGQPYCQLDLQKSILLDGCPPQQQQTMLECPQQLPMVAPPQDQPHCQLNLNKVTL
ncbi:hypothetical protein V6N13_118470 [Hibiscus sabdariffa]